MLNTFKVKKFSSLSKPKIYDALRNFENIAFQDIRKKLKSHIILETNAFKLFQKARNNKDVVEIQYSVEELARMENDKK
jgi:hypothetical protein